MHVTLQTAAELAGSALAGGNVWMIYSAIFKHAPERFPRTIDDWWNWFVGSNKEIASQHNPNGSNISPNPMTPA
jgi:hypothetical protein